MATYSAQELAEGWEFKILRSVGRPFRKPEILRTVLAEEAQAGWALVEKFDDSRLRFKRPVSSRAQDAERALDPYRTQYGISELALGLIIGGSVVGLMLTIAIVVSAFH